MTDTFARRFLRFMNSGLYVKAVDQGFPYWSIDKRELAMGIKVEGEHTDDMDIARKIALDHLAEHPKYYSKLKKAGL
jgi:hypothetical protein